MLILKAIAASLERIPIAIDRHHPHIGQRI
jgi:hypothetical protein